MHTTFISILDRHEQWESRNYEPLRFDGIFFETHTQNSDIQTNFLIVSIFSICSCDPLNFAVRMHSHLITNGKQRMESDQGTSLSTRCKWTGSGYVKLP